MEMTQNYANESLPLNPSYNYIIKKLRYTHANILDIKIYLQKSIFFLLRNICADLFERFTNQSHKRIKLLLVL